MTQKQAMVEPPPLAVEEGVFELGGPEPIWIWVDTCPTRLDDHPRVRAVVERLDGCVLDAIGRLW